jgi:predicted PurR-regulated permease PerM
MEHQPPRAHGRPIRLVTPTSPLRLIVPWVVLGLALALAWYFRDLFTLLMIAAAMAYVVVPLVDRLERARVPRSLAIVLVLLGLAGTTTLVLALVLPGIMDQITALASSLPAKIQQTVIPWANGLLLQLRRRFHVRIPTTVDAWLAQAGVRSSELAQRTTGLVLSAAGAGISVIEWVVESVIVMSLAFYLLADWHKMIEGVRGLVPRRALGETERIAARVDDALGRYVRGQLLVTAILGALFAAGLGALNVPAGVGLGLLTGMLSFVPYAGFLIAMTIATGLAAIDGGGPSHVLAVLGFMWLVHFLDITLVTPRILGGRLGLPPATVILALLAGGKVAGFVGLLAAIPVASVARVLLGELAEWYRGTRFFSASPALATESEAVYVATTTEPMAPPPAPGPPPPEMDLTGPSALRTASDGTPLIAPPRRGGASE